MHAGTSCRRLLWRGPRVLTAIVAAFAASWRFSNCAVRAGNHRNKGTIKIKTVEIKTKVFLESILPTTMALDSARHARAALASSSAASSSTSTFGKMALAASSKL